MKYLPAADWYLATPAEWITTDDPADHETVSGRRAASEPTKVTITKVVALAVGAWKVQGDGSLHPMIPSPADQRLVEFDPTATPLAVLVSARDSSKAAAIAKSQHAKAWADQLLGELKNPGGTTPSANDGGKTK